MLIAVLFGATRREKKGKKNERQTEKEIIEIKNNISISYHRCMHDKQRADPVLPFQSAS